MSGISFDEFPLENKLLFSSISQYSSTIYQLFNLASAAADHKYVCVKPVTFGINQQESNRAMARASIRYFYGASRRGKQSHMYKVLRVQTISFLPTRKGAVGWNGKIRWSAWNIVDKKQCISVMGIIIICLFFNSTFNKQKKTVFCIPDVLLVKSWPQHFSKPKK